jgi:hypothetical protein
MVATAPSVCPNCGAPGGGPFCAQCGQKNASLDPTLREVAGEVVNELANVDGRLFLSLRLLLLKPGFLTREHFDGRRARYLGPLRLYLIATLICFGVMASMAASEFPVTCSSCPPQTRSAQEQAMGEALATWAPRAMFLLVPAFAVLVALATRRSRRNYPQHLYFAMHVHAAWFFAIAFAVLGGVIPLPHSAVVATIVAVLYAGQYLKLALNRAYDVGFWRSVVVAPLLIAGYSILIALALLAIILPIVI